MRGKEVELDNEINSRRSTMTPIYSAKRAMSFPVDLRFHQEELFAAWEAAMEEQEQYEQVPEE